MKKVIEMTYRKFRAWISQRRMRSAIAHIERFRVVLDRSSAKQFLFWVPGGMPLMLDVEAAIAKALELRGHAAHAIICDGVFRACVRREVQLNAEVETWSADCAGCKSACEQKLQDFNIEYSHIGDYVTESQIGELRRIAEGLSWKDLDTLEYDGINVGKNIKSSITRYYKGAGYNGDPVILREFALSGLISQVAATNAFNRREPTNIFMSHGIYVDWGPALRTALKRGIHATCWGGSYLPARFYFRHPTDYRGDLDFHKLRDSRWQLEIKSPLTEQQSTRVDAYLTARYVKGASFDLKKARTYRGETGLVRKRYGIEQGRPVWGIMAHVNWDAVTDYAPMLFPDFDSWIEATIEKIRTVTTVDWLVKIHPAEAWFNPNTGVQEMIRQRFPSLPDHIHVVGYDDPINALDFYDLVDGAVTVYGTSGLELACMGKPVIVAGRAHYAGKGFTREPATIEEYLVQLESAHIFGPISRSQRQLARHYAYIYFLRRQIPFPPVENPDAHREDGFWRFDPRRAPLLRPGANPYIDFLADRMVDGGEFIMPENLVLSD